MKNLSGCPIISRVEDLCETCPIRSVNAGVAFTQDEMQTAALDRRNHVVTNPARFESDLEPARLPYAVAAEACIRAALNREASNEVVSFVPAPVIAQVAVEQVVA